MKFSYMNLNIFFLSATYVTGIIDPDRQRCRSTMNHVSHLPLVFNYKINHNSFNVCCISSINDRILDHNECTNNNF